MLVSLMAWKRNVSNCLAWEKVEGKLTCTASRYFWGKDDKPLPALPTDPPYTPTLPPVANNEGSAKLSNSARSDKLSETVSAQKPLPAPPSLKLTALLDSPSIFDDVVESRRKANNRKLMATPSLATLKSKSEIHIHL
jgi:hypothetical protein